MSKFLLCLQPQLTAGGLDVVPLLAAQGGEDLLSHKRPEKGLLGGLARTLPGQSLDLVVGD